MGEISGYKASYSVDGDTGTHIITNTHEIATTSITATKAWEDNNDQDGIRPDSVTLTVYANGVSTGRTVELTAASGWTATVEGLPLNENGKPITYTMVEETPAAGYTASTSGTTVTNTHISETIDIPVSKVWNDNDDQDGFRPDSVTVRLLADGVEVDDQTITAGTDWKHTFTGLAKYRDGGVEIVYTITEDPVAEYETSIRGYTVTNTHTPKTSDLSVTKVWDDNNDQDSKRADSVTISLYGNDKSTPLGTVTLSESNNWTGVWKDLPMYSGGNPVNYTVTETGATKSGADYSVVSAGYTITHAYNNAEGSPFRTEATVTNKYTPETIGLNVQKSWDDNDNQDGVRPASVTVELYYRVGEQGTWTATGKTLELNPGNEWDVTFTGLAKFAGGEMIYYNVVEEAVEGYTAQYSIDFSDKTYVTTVVNTHTPNVTSVTVTKDWVDSGDQDGIRPGSVMVTLYGRDKSAALGTAVLSDENGWSHTWNGLPENYAGNPIVYTVVEETVSGYTAQITRGTADNGGILLAITNTHIPETTAFPFEKVWDDNHDQDGIRPETVTIVLYADGIAVKNMPVTAGDNWSGVFTDLPRYKAGAEIIYTIDEVAVEGYTSTVNGNIVTNVHTPEKTQITVNKVWNDAGNQDGKRPGSIQVALFADNVKHQTVAITPDADGVWSYTFEGLAKYAGGKEIVYTVSEVAVSNGYSPSVNGLSITNTRAPETKAITVTKIWDDADNQDGIRPDTVTVHLLADGVEVAKNTFDITNGWATTFSGLPVYKDGAEIEYTITEDAVEGYTSTIDGFNITNKHIPAETSVTVKKVWDDHNDQDGIRPASVKLVVSGTDGSSREVVLSDENSWTDTVTGLPAYANGTKIIYTVSEPTVAKGYKVQVNGYTVTNTHTPETVDVPVSKVWDDADDQDGKRPDTVTVNLLANGNQVDTIDLKADNLWKHIFAGLPKYEAGVKITYTLEEVPVADYDTQINADTGVITNTHVPETVTIVANKVWNDADEQDGKRPAYIELHLLASGDHVFAQPQKVTADEDGNWSYTWSGLPKYNDGQLIRYSVTENAVYNERGKAYSTNYDVSRSADGNTITATITNSLTPEKTALTVEKVWDDTYNQDGLRPDSVTVELYANDVATGKTVTLHKDHGWIATFTELDEYQDGVKVAYRVVEKNVPEGYEASYETDTLTGMIKVINKHEIQKTSVTVSKVWVDDDNQDGIRPASINVTLYADGTPVKTITITAADHWQGSFADLNRYAAGKEILYEVKELTVDGYTTTITGNAESGFEITNAHETEKTSVKVSKVWVDGENRDGSRPDTLNVTLYRDGEAFQTAVLSKNDDWTWEFTGLDVHYANGKTHVYTVGETVPGGYTITNTHEPATISIPVTKVWNDAGNQDGIRPGSVTVALLADRVEIDTYTLTAADNWRHVFEGMQ